VQFCTQRKRFEECAQNLTFHVGVAKASLWLCLCRKFTLQNVGRSGCVRSQNQLCVWQCKDWHWLHESNYCYFKAALWTTLEYELVDANGSIQKVRVGPATRNAGCHLYDMWNNWLQVREGLRSQIVQAQLQNTIVATAKIYGKSANVSHLQNNCLVP